MLTADGNTAGTQPRIHDFRAQVRRGRTCRGRRMGLSRIRADLQAENWVLSKLFRNVPIINYLEMSPFQLLCSRWKCALERSPVVRAKRKCAFQRAAVRLRGGDPWPHVLVSLSPRVIFLG